MSLAHSRESQDARVASKWHRVGGRCEKGRRERLEGAGEPHLCQLQLCDHTQFSELVSSAAKYSLPCRVSGRLKDHHLDKKPYSTELARNYHSLSTNYHHYYQQLHGCFVNLSIRF